MKSKYKIIIGFIAISLISSIFTVSIIFNEQSIKEHTSEFSNHIVKELILIDELKSSTLRILSSSLEIILLINEKTFIEETEEETEEELINQGKFNFEKAFTSLSIFNKEHPDKIIELNKIKEKYNIFVIMSEQLIDAKINGVQGKKILELKEQFEEEETELLLLIKNLRVKQLQEVNIQTSFIKSLIITNTQFMLIGIILIIISSIITVKIILNKIRDDQIILSQQMMKSQKDLIKNEKLTAIGEFASRMSHDLRNPLSIIQNSLENFKILYGIDDSKLKQYEKIERSIERMTHQITDVLDFVQEKPLKLKPEYLSKMIVESIDSLNIPNDIKLTHQNNNIQFLCDKIQFLKVLNNIILNAIQAITNIGTITITTEENNDAIIIQIKDSGDGISKENIDKIFDPLFTTKQQGTGLGLAGVKSIIKSHGGIISVTSPPTVFTITLPKIIDRTEI